MNEDAFVLKSRDGAAPVLTGVDCDGRLDGTLFEMVLRQTYRNTTEQLLEVVYTFPLPAQSVLLGFASELNGLRQEGTLVAKQAAERTYEAALSNGDAPVMLEGLPGSLHTANIGNLKPGDTLVLEVRLAQTLSFEQGRLRVAIPATIAPRFGQPEAAGLQPQQIPLASPTVEYPLKVSIMAAGALAKARLDCPTHRFTQTPIDGGVRLEIAPGASLDRDVVVLVTPAEAHPSLIVQARDTVSTTAPVVAMAALQVPNGAVRERIALKLLVDCSGSMAGDSIASARRALQGMLAGLGPEDQFSLTRFGSRSEQVLLPGAATSTRLERAHDAVEDLAADLGGTEMPSALAATFALKMEATDAAADVLLITDGEVWEIDAMVAAARASHHRVFVIGVGSSPAESVLRALAEATGGACESATPGEALEAAAQRMLRRMRQARFGELRLDWGAQPVWQSPLPKGVFGGDTLIAWAGLATSIDGTGVRLLATEPPGTTRELARGETVAPARGDTLARLAAARRLAEADPAEAASLAVSYQLMSPYTNCILVHRRAAADRTTETAELHRVSSMLAAGWGATSTVRTRSATAARGMAVLACAPFERFRLADDMDAASAYIPAHKPPRFDQPEPKTLETIAREVANWLSDGKPLGGLPSALESPDLFGGVWRCIYEATGLLGDGAVAWVLLAHWVNARAQGLADPRIGQLLQPHVAKLDATLRSTCEQTFERILGRYPIDSYEEGRSRRLKAWLRANLG